MSKVTPLAVIRSKLVVLLLLRVRRLVQVSGIACRGSINERSSNSRRNCGKCCRNSCSSYHHSWYLVAELVTSCNGAQAD